MLSALFQRKNRSHVRCKEFINDSASGYIFWFPLASRPPFAIVSLAF